MQSHPRSSTPRWPGKRIEMKDGFWYDFQHASSPQVRICRDDLDSDRFVFDKSGNFPIQCRSAFR